MKAFAIIPAAGRGRRFGAAKQFQKLGEKPLFFYSLEAFGANPLIEEIALMVPPADVTSVQELINQPPLKQRVRVLAGGEERQESVRLGLEALPPCDIVVIHDGVRPFVTAAMIDKTIRAAEEFGGAVVGIPVQETTKRVTEGLLVKETVDRANLWTIQTPQAFRYVVLREAFCRAATDRFLGTDEAMLVERIGGTVKVIEGDIHNIKVTMPEDWPIAETILKMREVR